MFSIRSKVQNAVPTPISYNASNRRHGLNDTPSESSHSRSQERRRRHKSSTIKKKRKKKRKASEVVNINDYPSAKRRRISIIGVDVDPKKTKEIIQNKDFLLCEYHSNFPQFVVDELKSMEKSELNQNVSMKSCDNQWIVTKICSSPNQSQIIYWNTSLSIDDDNNNDNDSNINHKLNIDHHPNSPTKCYLIQLNKCIIYDPTDNYNVNDESHSNDTDIITIADIDHIHLLYPSASSFSTLRPHQPFYNKNKNKNSSNQQQQQQQQQQEYNNPFMPHLLNKNIFCMNNNKNQHNKDREFDEMNNNELDDTVLCPLFPSSTSRSITSISGVLFLSKDHRSIYIIPHDHVTSIHHHTTNNQFIYGSNRNITYKIALLTDTIKYNERITYSQVLPQPRVGSHHSANTYKILLGTTHGRLFYITIIMNKNATIDKPHIEYQTSDIYFDHGTDLSSKVIIRDHELLFAFYNENENISNNNNNNMQQSEVVNDNNGNVGWLGYVVSKIKLGATALSQQVAINNGIDENSKQLQLLRQSGLRFDENIRISSICFGLNQNCTKVIGYTLRSHSIDCIEFTDKDYKLLWTFSLRNIINPNDKTISISLLGQGLSVLTGFVDQHFGHALTVRLFKINTNYNNKHNHNQSEFIPKPLIFYGQCPVQLPSHIHVNDLYKLRYQSFWSYYNDQENDKKKKESSSGSNMKNNRNRNRNNRKNMNDKEEMDEDDVDIDVDEYDDDDDDDDDAPKLKGLGHLRLLQRQTSMAEFVEQRNDERNDIIQCQHYLVAPFGMVWSTEIAENEQCTQFIAVFPLLSTDKTDERLVDLRNIKCDEIWERLYGDYNRLYPDMQLNNSCGPDGDHFNNDLVTVFEPSSPSGCIPFYGGGCMLLPFHFETGWKQKEEIRWNEEKNEDDEKQIIEETEGNETIWNETSKLRSNIKQLRGGGYGYFMNDKYQIMRLKYSLQSAMAAIHPNIEHYQQQQIYEESKKIKTMIRLAFSEYRNGDQGKPRSNRISDKLINQNINILSKQICKISESILNLKLFDTFSTSNIIQSTIKSLGFNTNKMRLGINQIQIKLQTYSDYIDFLKNSPSYNDNNNNNHLWHFINNQQKCDIVEHREYLQIAVNLYNYITNNNDDNDHYGNRKQQFDETIDHDIDDYDDDDDEEESDDDDDDDDEDDDDGVNIDEYDGTTDSRSTLSNFGDSNHNMYRQKYFSLKKGFIPKLLECVISKRGDIEYINTYGNDENDTFFMKIGQITQILVELPKFLKLFLSHLTYKFYVNYIDDDKQIKYNDFELNEDIALTIRELSKHSNIIIVNERDELVHQLITIRISLELFQCIINTVIQHRKTNELLYNETFNKYNRTLWNYSNYIRTICMQICQIVVPFMNKIGPLLSSSKHNDQSVVIDTDNNYYDYILKKERNQIYRNMNEISRMIMESYNKELHLLQHQYQDRTAFDGLNSNFIKDRFYLIGNLFNLFPIGNSIHRWKTDLLKDSVNKIAFDYGDCQYLVKLCDWNNIISYSYNNNITISDDVKQNIFNVCIQRFINNLIKYKYNFMHFYFQQHTNNIDAFLCIDIRKSDIWKSYKNDNNNNDEIIDINKLLNKCISNYIAESSKNNNDLSIIDEYSWIHNISIGDYTNTAKQLFHITTDKDTNYTQNLQTQTISLSMAKLSIFADNDDDDNDDYDGDDSKDALNQQNPMDIDTVKQQLLWINAKALLRSYSPQNFNDKILTKMSPTDIVKNLITFSLNNTNTLNLQNMEQILSLILNLEPLSCSDDLNEDSLITIFIENVINFNKQKWENLRMIINPSQRIEDKSINQIINRTAIYEITKYLYNRKTQSQFLEKHRNNDDDDEEDEDDYNNNNNNNKTTEYILWELWASGISHCTKNDDDPQNQNYYAVRAYSYAQMT